MALSAAQVVDRVRDEYPDASPVLVPDLPLVRHLSDYQRDLMRRAFLINRNFRAQQAAIAFDVSADNDPATVGRGTAGGLPVTVDRDADTYELLHRESGGLVEFDLEETTVLVAERAVSAATANTLNAAGVAWTVNGYAGRLARVVSGKGAGTAPRRIASNTASQITVTQNWEVTPDPLTSTFEIIEETGGIEEIGGVTAIPPETQRAGYLVRIDANGTPYIDLSKPLRATFATGAALPPHHAILGGVVRYASGILKGQEPPLYIATYDTRNEDYRLPSVFEMNSELYLCGPMKYWDGAGSIDLRYVPIPPKLAKRTDEFLLDDAESCFLAAGLRHAHRRLAALKYDSADVKTASAELRDAESSYLSSLVGHEPAEVFQTRDVMGEY